MLIISIIIFLILYILIIYNKNNFLFLSNSTIPKSFGFDNNISSFFYLPFFTIFIALFIYYILHLFLK